MITRVSTGWIAATAWALFAGLSVWLTLKNGGIALDTDASMRLVGVRDLLAGQSWFDTSQHRMDTPYGLSMHWSRLADLGPALLIMLFRPLGANAEMAMLYAWPLLVFLPVLVALARIAAHLAGLAAAIFVLPLALLCVEIYGLFTPGGIDHHNLQLALSLWTLVFLIEKRPGAAACAIAVSLGIGLETLPYAVATILVGCLWLGEDSTRALRFGGWLAATALALLFGVTATAYRFTPVCDTFSEFYAALLAVGGIGLAAASLLPRWRPAALPPLIIVVLGLAWLLNPSCFHGPFVGIGPHLREIFLSRINEARPAFDFMNFAPSEFVAGYCYAAFALLMIFFLDRTRTVLLVLLFAIAAMIIATLEIRAVPFAILFALPGLAAAIATYVLPRGLIITAVALLLGSDAAFALAGAEIEGDVHQAARIKAYEAQVACGEIRATVPLAALPHGRVAAFVDQGPAVLLYSPDQVVAGPYHRGADGIEDTYAIFTGSPEQARAILKRRGIDYVMACRTAPDWDYYIAQAPDGLLARLARNEVPAWLAPAGRSGDSLVWKILKN